MEIELRNIHKAFGSNEVLKGVDLKLKSGEVHALMGENGAGKSTLMNILTGIHKQDKGQIFVDGKEISFKNPLEAEAYGIAFIHQELNIWPNLSILENLFLMHSVTNGMGILDFKAMRAMAEQKCREIEIELPLDMEAGECSVGQQQMTEIVRNLLLDGKVVATNRHKSIEQKSDSLEEFREAYGDAAVSQLTVRLHSPQYKDMARIMPGAVMAFKGTIGVMQCSGGRNNGKVEFFKSTKGNKTTPKKCVLLAQNAGMVFIPA